MMNDMDLNNVNLETLDKFTSICPYCYKGVRIDFKDRHIDTKDTKQTFIDQTLFFMDLHLYFEHQDKIISQFDRETGEVIK